MIPRRGAIVASITEKDLKDVLEVRRTLEIMAAEIACDRITPELLQDLAEAGEEFRELKDSEGLHQPGGGGREVPRCHLRCHGQSAPHQHPEQSAGSRCTRYRLEYLKDTDSHEKLDGEHQAIYENIKNGDKEAVCAMVGQHIDNQKIAILAAIRENEKKKAEKA